MRTIVLLIGTAIASCLYRAGGAAKTGDIFDFARRSWVRDWLIPPVALTVLWLLGVPFLWWVFLLIWGLMGAALSTYFDTIFGFDSMYAHGAGIGLATLPLLWVGIHWYSILAYALVLSLSMGLISHKTKLNAVAKELCRGALIIVLLPILLI
jgi:hypothetical protein